MRTFTLSCREEFSCLDATDRIGNFKTPIRKTEETSKTRLNCKTKKLVLTNITCDHWIGNEVFCKFCNAKLGTSLSEKRKFSHLLTECKAIPGCGPLPKKRKLSEKNRMKRLAEIGVAPDPGGAL